jgi:hypothetical protein
MKEKKGKKSVDLDNSNKRSTLLKSINNATTFGATISSISTTSSSELPPIYLRTTDTIKMCNFVGKYDTKKTLFNNYLSYDDSKLIFIGGAWSGYGWYYWNNGFTDFATVGDPDFRFNNDQGYLFVFFTKPTEATLYDKDVCSICYKYIFEARTNKCDTVDSNQGKIFAVVISSIAQINALNQTVGQSDGFSLSTIINASDNPIIVSVINDLKRYTPNPIEIDGGPTKLYDLKNHVKEGRDNFGLFFKYKDFNVLDVISADKFKDGDRGSNIFTEFMIITYTTGYSVSFVFENGVESGIVGTLDQLELNQTNGGFRVIRVRKTFGSFFGDTNTVGFTISFTQPPYFETRSKKLSINFKFEIKFE